MNLAAKQRETHGYKPVCTEWVGRTHRVAQGALFDAL